MLRAFFSICGICGASGEGELSVFLHEVLGALLELFDGVDLHAALHNGFLHAGGRVSKYCFMAGSCIALGWLDIIGSSFPMV